jgi:hypothetical protein
MSKDGTSPLSEAVIPEDRVGAHRFPLRLSFPITIYLCNEFGHEHVEQAVDDLVGQAGFRITERDDPVRGSWFRRMRATRSRVSRSLDERAALDHALVLQLREGVDADSTDRLMARVTPLLTSLQDIEKAVIQIGALLIVKVDGKILVHQLTAREQQLILDHSPSLLAAPDRILRALRLTSDDGEPVGVHWVTPLARVGVTVNLQLEDPEGIWLVPGPAPGEVPQSGEGQPSAERIPATWEPGVPEPSTALDRPYRRSLVQAFTDGLGGVFDLFGSIHRQRWSRLPAFEDMLAGDARELCRELGLVPDGGNGSGEGTNR